MKVVKGMLISIEESDIKKGVLNLGKRVKIVGDNFDISNFEIVKIIAPALTTIGNDSFSYNASFTLFKSKKQNLMYFKNLNR